MKTISHCAIYTRKSSEEGLDQEFNSLDAQREAGEAYIASQKHEGWKVLPDRYDDGGFSGGNMDRPGLKRLLGDIATGKVKIVVVYKVDRLTRALSDFAKIVEQFDTQGVSFVSVTQQFNTTSSMGRLTLNVLLSFAQFEREVTSERIRDKIAASKKKGMWMGGVPPLGYDVVNKKLVINKEEAKTVSFIFETYLQLGSVKLLKEELDRLHLRTKRRETQKGKYAGGARYSRGSLYNMLINPIFRGMVHHQGKLYPGEHTPIINEFLWQQVQDKIHSKKVFHKSGQRSKSPSLLMGLIFDSNGNRFSPTHSNKDGKKYRYYLSQALIQYRSDQKPQIGRIPAQAIESLVQRQIIDLLNDRKKILEVFGADAIDVRTAEQLTHKAQRLAATIKETPLGDNWDLLRSLIAHVTVKADQVVIHLNRDILVREICPAQEHQSWHEPLILIINVRILMSGHERRIVMPDEISSGTNKQIEAMRQAFVNGYRWREQFFSGNHGVLDDIAHANKVHATYVGRMIELSFLPPKQVEQILAGQMSADTTILQLTQQMPLKWQ